MAINALDQFELTPVFGSAGQSVGFSQSNLLMVVSGLVILGVLWIGMRPRAVVPGRMQALAELCYQSVLDMTVGTIGEEGRAFFPFVFTIFFFVLLGNLLGIIPFSFTFTSELAVTLALTLLVNVLVLVVSLWLHGWKFFTYFFPSGVPKMLAPLIVVIEVISYLSRNISLSVRLFANMVAGHVMWDVFAGFMLMLVGGLGTAGYFAAVFPLAINVALVGFELLVGLLQAYVFAILTCIYLHDAVHLH